MVVDSYILGPVLEDILGLGLNDASCKFATAYYSSGALDRVTRMTPTRLCFMCRLDTGSAEDWKAGRVDPEALLRVLRDLANRGTEVVLYVSSTAHVKAYVGGSEALFGSANLSMRGFGGSHELVQRLQSRPAREALSRELDLYAAQLVNLPLDELESYVVRYREEVAAHEDEKDEIDRLPAYARDRLKRLGDYAGFRSWLETQESPAARTILDRAAGQGQLSGHIWRNFYGLRQFLLAYPEERHRFNEENPDTYKLAGDPPTEALIRHFVERYATDEVAFSLRAWKTYLPKECGGTAAKHGGTIGNLNRMLPLVARYVGEIMQEVP